MYHPELCRSCLTQAGGLTGREVEAMLGEPWCRPWGVAVCMRGRRR